MIEQAFLKAALAAVVVYVTLVALAQLLRRWRGVAFRWSYHVFAGAGAFLVAAHLLPEALPGRMVALTHLTAATIVLAAFPLVTLLNRACWIRYDAGGRRVDTPRVLTDLTGALVVVAAVLASLQFVYGHEVPGLLAGSGVVALVLGLGMQDQLKNLFAGLALHYEKSFKVGDWLLFDGIHAKVIEISWRSVRLLSEADVQIEVSNHQLLEGTIYNFQRPTPVHSERFKIGLHYDIPPAEAMRVLAGAAATVPGVVADPAPHALLDEFADAAVVYEVEFWFEDHCLREKLLSEVRTHCWYALKRAGMEIPYPQMVLHRAVAATDVGGARRSAAAMLRAHKIFGCLTAEQCEALVQASPVVMFARHEHVLTQGAAGESMFVLVRGAVDVRIAREGQTTSVAALGAGDCIGEMSLLTGDPRSATVVAEEEVEAVEIGKAVFGAFVRSNPAVLEQLSELLAQRQLANAKHATSGAATNSEQVRSGILRRLRSFFALS